MPEYPGESLGHNRGLRILTMTSESNANLNIVLVSLYHHNDFAVRTLFPIIEGLDGVNPYAIFFKHAPYDHYPDPTSREEKIFLDIVGRLQPALLGFSVQMLAAPLARRLTRMVKRHYPSVLVLWGGIHPTTAPETCIGEVDILCRGEGEGAITDLVSCLRDHKPYDNIPNLWVKTQGRIVRNLLRPLLQDLDSVPFLSYGKEGFFFIEDNKVSQCDPFLFCPCVDQKNTRGCQYHCTFCPHTALRPIYAGQEPYVRRRSVDRLIAEIKTQIHQSKRQKEYVSFDDEFLPTEEAWVAEFLQRYKQEVGLPFMVQVDHTMSFETLRRLIDAGLERVFLGIQSGSDYIRHQIFRRPDKATDMQAFGNEAVRLGARVEYLMILDNPYDDVYSLRETVGWMLNLSRPFKVTIFSLMFFPECQITKMALREGRIPSEATTEEGFHGMGRRWFYHPTLFPWTMKRMLQNVIWILDDCHTSPDFVRHAVFDRTWGARLCLLYLHLRAFVVSRLWGLEGPFARDPRGVRWSKYVFYGLTYLVTGRFGLLAQKIQKHLNFKIPGQDPGRLVLRNE